MNEQVEHSGSDLRETGKCGQPTLDQVIELTVTVDSSEESYKMLSKVFSQ